MSFAGRERNQGLTHDGNAFVDWKELRNFLMTEDQDVHLCASSRKASHRLARMATNAKQSGLSTRVPWVTVLDGDHSSEIRFPRLQTSPYRLSIASSVASVKFFVLTSIEGEHHET